MKILVVLAFVVVCASSDNIISSRIAGGSPAQLGQIPYQAGLICHYLEGNGVCGGTLVSPTHVLTAAHCVSPGAESAYVVTVVLGSTFLYSGGVRINTTNYITHPDWIAATQQNDVALVVLPEPVQNTSNISPAALPSGSLLNANLVGQTVTASGYGTISAGSGISPYQYLNSVQLVVISNDNCSLYFPQRLTDNNLCTSGAGDVGTCRGDSGGPLTLLENDIPTLVGIVSFGFTTCDFGWPAIYTLVAAYIDFINEHINT